MEKKKDFTYRGKTIEELTPLEVREFAHYLNSRERRTVLRQFHDLEDFIARAKRKNAKKKPIKTHKRYLVIVPQMVGMNIGVHTGKGFASVIITKEMLGHRLGEFALTRGKVTHGSAGIGATKGTKHKAKK